MTYKLYASCPNEMTELLAEEIKSLGGTEVKEGYRVVYFNADEKLYYQAHLKLRLASRIFRIIKEVPAYSPTITFDKLKRIKFGDLFSHEHPLKINVVVANKEGKIEGHLVGSKIREAVTDSFAHFHKKEANLSSWHQKVTLKGYYYKNRLMLSLDTSLEALHKRGFRCDGHPAPLKETLAAALLKFCNYDGSVPFLDPMCGSGTIAVEAALIASNTAPLLKRPEGTFGFEYLNDFNQSLWQEILAEAREESCTPQQKIYARDLDPNFIKIAKQSAEIAGMDAYIDFEPSDFFSSSKPAEKGLMIANIPYGLRLDEEEIDDQYLQRIGTHLKDEFKGWQCGILLPKDCPTRAFGMKPSKTLQLLNGKVPVKFVLFDIFTR